VLLRTEALTTIHYRIQDSAGEEVAAAAGCRERAEEQQSLLLHGMLRPSAAAAAAASHHECWSLNGQNRLGAHEWPGGGSHLVVLLHQQPPAFRSSVSQAALCLLLLLLLLLPQQPFLAVRRGTERAAAGWHQGPLGVRAGAALGGGRLVAGLCSAGDPPQQGVAEEAGQAGREDSEATPSQPPLVVAAGAGAVHPAVLLVAVLVDALPAVVEGRLHAAHAGEGVQGGLCRAEAGVVAQPSTGKSTWGCTCRAPTPATADADDGLGGGRGGGGGGTDGGGGGSLLWFSAGVWRLRDHSGVGRRLRD